MEKQILKALKKVSDPEININIVDLGLIYNIKAKKGKILIIMTLTSPVCPYGVVLKNDVRKAVNKIEGVNNVLVRFVFTPLWSPERISKEYRLQMGF